MSYHRILKPLISTVCLLCFSGISSAQTEAPDRPKWTVPIPAIPFAPQSYVCYRTPEPLLIDGKMDEAAWQKAPWSNSFVDIEGDLKPKPTWDTRVKMLWDDEWFYVAAKLEEPHVWARLTQRDTVIFYDNDFEVFIDPDGDTHHYYELEVNAFSTEWDLFLDKPYRDGGPALHAWDIAELRTAVHVNGTINNPADTDEGWTVEIAIPWFILKEAAHRDTPPKPADQWRINFSRVEWKTEAHNGGYRKQIDPATGKHYPEFNWVWSPQGVINMHYPEMWGFVQFSAKNAGEGSDAFETNPDEAVKWVLREIYYQQKAWFDLNKRYSKALTELKIAKPDIAGLNWPPQMFTGLSTFEVRLTNKKGDRFWSINQDGQTSVVDPSAVKGIALTVVR